MKSRNRVLNENNTIQDKDSRYYNKNTLVLDMQTPISAKKFTLNQQGKNAAVDSSLLQIKGISERQNTSKNTNKSPAYQRKDSVKERDEKKNEATHYKQFLQNE